MNNVRWSVLIVLCALQALISFSNAAIPLLSADDVQSASDVSQADWLIALLGTVASVALTAIAKIQQPGKKNPNVIT